MHVDDVAIAHAPFTPHAAAERAPAGPWSRWDRLGFASGIVAAGLYIAGAIVFIAWLIPIMPAIDAPVAERVAFYARMARNGAYLGLSYTAQSQMLFLLVFLGAFFPVLRRAEGGSGALSFAVLGAGVTLAVFTPMAALVEDHLMLGGAVAGLDAKLVNSYDGLVPKAFALGGFPQAILLLGTAALLPRAGMMPRWLAGFGVVVAVLGLVGTGTLVNGMMFPASHLASLLFRVWLLALAVSLLRRSRRS